MKKVDETDSGTVVLYVRDNDKLQIERVELKQISYIFWQGKFFTVSIETEENTNWFGLKKEIFAKFGKGHQENRYI